MKKTSNKLFTSISLIIIVTMAGTPLAAHATSEVVAWGDPTFLQTVVPGGLSNVQDIAAGGDHSSVVLPAP